jgi:hypothetical protein
MIARAAQPLLNRSSLRPEVRRLAGVVMNLKFGTNVTVFLLFFGIALLDAIQSHDWLRAALWLAIGLVFLRADALRRQP